MGPDIEWHVGENDEQETIVRTTQPIRSRRLWVLLSAIGLGLILGILYRSIPEPPGKPITPPPTPANPAPLPAREPLEAAIQRDAQRLATLRAGDPITFDPSVSRMPQAYANWYASLQNVTGSWGPITPLTPYTVFETGTLSSGVAWATVGQFRHDDFFRQTRFYRWQADHWVWTLPALEFWTGAQAEISTGVDDSIGPVKVVYPIVDAPFVGSVLERFTHAYWYLCESLQCPHPPSSSKVWTPGLAINLTIMPDQTQPVLMGHSAAELYIGLPSQRVVGYYENPNDPGDPYTAMAYDTLLEPVARLASGNPARWENNRGGELFLQAVVEWKRAQIRARLHLLDSFYAHPDNPSAHLQQADLAGGLPRESLVPLDSLWDGYSNGQNLALLEYVAANEAQAIVTFIDKQYGQAGVVRFLNMLGRASSLEEALRRSLFVSFGDFNREWLAWIAGG